MKNMLLSREFKRFFLAIFHGGHDGEGSGGLGYCLG
jgi:hypothetical protein